MKTSTRHTKHLLGALSILTLSGPAIAADAIEFQNWGNGLNTPTLSAGESLSVVKNLAKSGYAGNPGLMFSAWAHAGGSPWYTFQLTATSDVTIDLTPVLGGANFAPGLSLWASGASKFDGGSEGIETGFNGWGDPHSFNAVGQIGDFGTAWMSGANGNMLQTLAYAVSGPARLDSSLTGWGEVIKNGVNDISIDNSFEQGVTGSASGNLVQLQIKQMQAGLVHDVHRRHRSQQGFGRLHPLCAGCDCRRARAGLSGADARWHGLAGAAPQPSQGSLIGPSLPIRSWRGPQGERQVGSRATRGPAAAAAAAAAAVLSLLAFAASTRHHACTSTPHKPSSPTPRARPAAAGCPAGSGSGSRGGRIPCVGRYRPHAAFAQERAPAPGARPQRWLQAIGGGPSESADPGQGIVLGQQCGQRRHGLRIVPFRGWSRPPHSQSVGPWWKKPARSGFDTGPDGLQRGPNQTLDAATSPSPKP